MGLFRSLRKERGSRGGRQDEQEMNQDWKSTKGTLLRRTSSASSLHVVITRCVLVSILRGPHCLCQLLYYMSPCHPPRVTPGLCCHGDSWWKAARVRRGLITFVTLLLHTYCKTDIKSSHYFLFLHSGLFITLMVLFVLITSVLLSMQLFIQLNKQSRKPVLYFHPTQFEV